MAMYVTKQFSIFMVNKPGVLAQVLGEFARAKLNMPCSETEVLCVNLDNQSGALAGVAEKLSKKHINISYAYCTAGAKGGRTTGVLKVADVTKAMRILEKDHKKVGKSHPVVRRSRASRK